MWTGLNLKNFITWELDRLSEVTDKSKKILSLTIEFFPGKFNLHRNNRLKIYFWNS
jgi:hypothetical protein